MSKILYVGLDVHKDSIVVASAPAGDTPAELYGTIGGTLQALDKLVKKLAKPNLELRFVYEAGPCGYVIYRHLQQHHYHCKVIAPSLIPIKAGDRVKTDRRDARQLARLFRAGELTPIYVPDEEDEAVRDLVRALMSLRGVALLSAMTIVGEVGDLTRFESPTQLMSYLGLTPSEHSSGQKRQQGSITKAGNGACRRALVEAAHHYNVVPRVSPAIQQRQEGQSKEVRAIALKAQQRLHGRYRAMIAQRKKTVVVVTALARELCGFIWAIACQVSAPQKLQARAALRTQTPSKTAAPTREYKLKSGRRQKG